MSDSREAYKARYCAAIRTHVREKRRVVAMFEGVEPVRFAPGWQRKASQEICDLFGDLRLAFGLGESQIFQRAIADPEKAQSALFAFVRDVRTCPPEVLAYAKNLLSQKKA